MKALTIHFEGPTAEIEEHFVAGVNGLIGYYSKEFHVNFKSVDVQNLPDDTGKLGKPCSSS